MTDSIETAIANSSAEMNESEEFTQRNGDNERAILGMSLWGLIEAMLCPAVTDTESQSQAQTP